jgi:hypothetical protein
LGANSILVQMDNLVVVEALNLNTGYSMISASILDECRSLLSEFGKISLEHCNRESNSVAHALALRGRDDVAGLPTFFYLFFISRRYKCGLI